MGRRRKHDGDSGRLPIRSRNNQNNNRLGLVTLYCIATRPFAATHIGDSTPPPRQLQVSRHFELLPQRRLSSRNGERETGDGPKRFLQVLENQGRFSIDGAWFREPSSHENLESRKRLADLVFCAIRTGESVYRSVFSGGTDQGGRRSRGSFFQIKDVLLPAIALAENFLPPLPTIPGPPFQFFAEGYYRRSSAAPGSMLEIIPFVAIAVVKKSLVEMIVDARG